MTFDKVATMVADYKGIERSAIKPESTFPEMKLDSLDLADLAMNLEDEFSVTIELSPSIKTMADLVRVIDEAKNA
ncbi:phosphopantetheine-binding protein [Bacillota bacterium Meth-B3]|nr:phosphopantetheine-binding protein [Christensenellaceae bacterium]